MEVPVALRIPRDWPRIVTKSQLKYSIRCPTRNAPTDSPAGIIPKWQLLLSETLHLGQTSAYYCTYTRT